MKITVEQITPWKRALDAARWTKNLKSLNKEPGDKFKIDMMMSGHSPKRLVEYDIKIEDIPYCNATHFVRHFVGVEKFQASLRNDRNEEIDDRRKLPQDYPVKLWLTCNAQSLINISIMRLCGCAEETTRAIWREVVEKVREIDPIVARFMVRQCIYRGFCPERNSKCQYVHTQKFIEELEAYRESFLTCDKNVKKYSK